MSSNMATTHLVVRTSPKGPGQPFIGTCSLCGKTGLPASAALEPCENVRGVAASNAVVEAITGEPVEWYNDPVNYNDPAARRYRLRQALAETLNRHSAENGSDTPDWILADHLMACLDAWENSIIDRERWYGREKHMGPGQPAPDCGVVGGVVSER